MNRTVTGVVFWLAMGLLGSARADVFAVQGGNAAGKPGDRVFVELTYDYGAGFNVIVEDLALEYEHAGILFVRDQSTIGAPGMQGSYSAYVDSLKTFAQTHSGSMLENTNPILPQPDRKGYALSFFTADGVGQPRSGLVQFRAAFDILASAVPGKSYAVSFPQTNVLVNEVGTEFFYPSALGSLHVTAVPEPEIAFMMVPGLVLVAAAVRRRRSDRK